MILRNRDLNIQQQKEADQQKRKATTQLGLNNGPVKRQAAHLIKEEQKEQNEPKPKRTCNGQNSNSILQDFSNTLCIDSANRKSLVEEKPPKLSPIPVPCFEFDQENSKDFTAVSEYVQEIFIYYKSRECLFRVSDYVKKHPGLNLQMRTKVVNWLIELQETFELNHETLYLAVKLFDLFMDRTQNAVPPKELQLIASAAVFIASKFDERSPPLIDDFIYMAEDGFTREQMMAMERGLLKAIEFDLGAPLSYRFLRRYARVAKEDMGTLTLARYVLETSLMSLHFSRMSESLIAAASLLLAKRMKGTANDMFIELLQKCCGYAIGELEPLTWELNRMLVQRKQLFGQHNDNVFRKYSHEIFFEVANIPPLQEHLHNGRHNPHAARRRTSGSSRPLSRAMHN